jgi:hypothetical protein
METLTVLMQFVTTGLQVLMTGIVGVGAVYLRGQMKKAENLRRQQFDKLIAEMERKDRFRLAAIDKRLAAHQRAYALHEEMVAAGIFGDKVSEMNSHISEFWKESSLYLCESARSEFRWAWNFFSNQAIVLARLKEMRDDKKYEAQKEKHLKDWERFMGVPSVIEKALNLESLGNEPAFGEAKERILKELDI